MILGRGLWPSILENAFVRAHIYTVSRLKAYITPDTFSGKSHGTFIMQTTSPRSSEMRLQLLLEKRRKSSVCKRQMLSGEYRFYEG